MKDLSKSSWKKWYKRFVGNEKDLIDKYLFNYKAGISKKSAGYTKCNMETDYDFWLECMGGDDYVKNMKMGEKFYYMLHRYFGKWIVRKDNI